MLQAALAKRRGAFDLAVELEAEPGATLVVVGESGAGKTTLLRLLAGLEEPDEGRISVDGRRWCDTAARVSLPAWAREVGYVPQDLALFPHLSVAENVAFGPRARGDARRAARGAAEGTLERLGIVDLARRRPAELSGGQRQRVALARALALEPRLLLLDEPLSALDVESSQAVRGELRAVLAGLSCSCVLVTHSPLDAMVFGDAIAVMERGRVSQRGGRDELLRHPRSAWVARLLGLNLFHGRVAGTGPGGVALIATGHGMLACAEPGASGTVFAAVHPQDITLHLEPPGGSAQNLFAGPILEMSPEPPAGERLRVALGTSPPLVAEVTRLAVERLDLRVGVRVWASFKATGVRVYS